MRTLDQLLNRPAETCSDDVPNTVADLLSAGFPALSRPLSPGAGLPVAHAWDGREELRLDVTVTAGTIKLEIFNPVLREAAENRRRDRAGLQLRGNVPNPAFSSTLFGLDESGKSVPVPGKLGWGARPFLDDEPVVLESPAPRRVTEWSRKSKSNMCYRLAGLDYQPLMSLPGDKGMVTLSYPGEWEIVAPDGKKPKEHLRVLEVRWGRAWGQVPPMIWKLEAQRRGAPHLHLFTVIPAGTAVCGCRVCEAWLRREREFTPAAVMESLPFRLWLSHQWADVVDHPDPEQRRRHVLAGTGVDIAQAAKMRDPRRLAVYFLKHAAAGQVSSKADQNEVPAVWLDNGGPGRFWGYKRLGAVELVAGLPAKQAVHARRLLRRYARAQGRTRVESVQRINARTGEVGYRTVKRRTFPFQGGRVQGGWLLTNDGEALADGTGRYLRSIAVEAGPGIRPCVDAGTFEGFLPADMTVRRHVTPPPFYSPGDSHAE